jgi:hypothetical protein
MNIEEDWEFDALGIYNYKKHGEKYGFFNYIKQNCFSINGDICEAGVFNGSSLLATGLLLKELGSEKQVYGYDTFEGFPPVYDPNDDLEKFDDLFKQEVIDKDHYSAVKKNIKIRSFVTKKNIDVSNISSSGSFVCTSLKSIQDKINLLGLDNVHLVKGTFEGTMNSSQTPPKSIMAALLDCDLYQSYKTALPFIWPRMSEGGYVFLDEYYSLKFPGARIATNEFFQDKQHKPQKHAHIHGEFERWFLKK